MATSARRDGASAAGPTVRGRGGEELLVSARLGWLYLEQDHLGDAESVFRAALDWRPDDADAADGLEATLRRREERRQVVDRLKRYLAVIRRHTRPTGESGSASHPWLLVSGDASDPGGEETC